MNTEGAKENVGEKPGYIYEISAEFGNQRNFSVRGNFPVGATKEHIDGELDKLLAAIGRQQARACLPAERARLRQMERQLLAFQKRTAIEQEKFKGHKSLPVVAKAEIDNAETNLAEQRIQISEQKDKIKELEAEAK